MIGATRAAAVLTTGLWAVAIGVETRGAAPTLERRIEWTARLLQVYATHSIRGEPMEDARARELARTKVLDELRKSEYLRVTWKMEITPLMLRREVERIATSTRWPDRLRELLVVLDNDPVAIQESLARPLLVDRLSRSFFGADDGVHGAAHARARGLREELLRGSLKPEAEHPLRQTLRYVARRSETAGGSRESEAPGERVRLVDREELENLRAELPATGQVSELREGVEGYWIDATIAATTDTLEVGRYFVPRPQWDAWWQEESTAFAAVMPNLQLDEAPIAVAPESEAGSGPCADYWDNGILDDVPIGRSAPAAVWTGTVAIFWGGGAADVTGVTNSGGRYDPALDAWTATSMVGAPEARREFTAVWTGSEMIVWGGWGWRPGQVEGSLANGARYNPLTDSWAPVSVVGAPEVRHRHTAVWTGSEMLVWGGRNYYNSLASGARYNPGTDSWNPIATSGAPSARYEHTATWAGSVMVVWGGVDDAGVPLATGARYVPGSNSWSTVANQKAPAARWGHTAVWSSSHVIIWGGINNTASENTGGRYDPSMDRWTAVTTTGSPTARGTHSAVWTGTEMIVWGGYERGTTGNLVNTGGRYNPTTDRWTATSTTNAPWPRQLHGAVFAGGRMIVWAGLSGVYNTGGRYDPATNSWTPTSIGGGPTGRSAFSTVWTGNEMIAWGGYNFTRTNTGSRYDPALDSWSPTATVGAPSPRTNHTAVWSGSRMLVWGGNADPFGQALGDGRSYDPISNAWAVINSTGAPSARADHAAVWTGDRMVVWGGNTQSGATATGARYDPISDSWSPTSATNAPQARYGATAIWTGAHAVFWGGGRDAAGYAFNTGGKYDPVNDAWSPTTTQGAPLGRADHSVVWTGHEMIVWGGQWLDPDGSVFRDGGRYDPILDSWVLTTLLGAPTFRLDHSAVWTGSEMIVWGGSGPTTVGSTGGRYRPTADIWTPTSTVLAPPSRSGHGAAWTGTQMVVWGGNGGLSDGGRYVTGPNAPTGVAALVASRLAGTVEFQWGAVPGADRYDVVKGGLATLRSSGGDFSVSAQSCVADDLTGTSATDAETPPPGDGIWYLVRAVACSSAGSYDSGAPSQIGSRDGELAVSGTACP